MQKDRKKRIESIIGEFYRGGLSRRLEDATKGLIASDMDSPEVEHALKSLFNQNVTEAKTTDKATLDSLQDMHRRLGFPDAASPAPRKSVLRRKLISISAAAAVVFAIIGTGLYISQRKDIPAIENPLVAESAGRFEVPVDTENTQNITLPDGSSIEIMPGARLAYNDKFADERSVYLDGEAYFKVEKMNGVPFTVNTNSITVTVLGTEFRMKAAVESPTSEVILTTGKVEVAAEGIENVTLVPGQHLTYHRDYQTVELSEIGEQALARMRGITIDFKGETLSDAFRNISKYYEKRLEVEETIDVSRKMIVPFSGTETIEEVMFTLQLITGDLFEYEIKGDTIRVTRPRQ